MILSGHPFHPSLFSFYSVAVSHFDQGLVFLPLFKRFFLTMFSFDCAGSPGSFPCDLAILTFPREFSATFRARPCLASSFYQFLFTVRPSLPIKVRDDHFMASSRTRAFLSPPPWFSFLGNSSRALRYFCTRAVWISPPTLLSPLASFETRNSFSWDRNLTPRCSQTLPCLTFSRIFYCLLEAG